MLRFLSLFYLYVGFSVSWAEKSYFDVFGTNQALGLKICQNYGAKIESIEHQRVIARSLHRETKGEVEAINRLQAEIKEKYHFPDVKIDSVFYPDRKEIFTTLNVCLAPRPTYPLQNYPQTKSRDIIDRMHFFVIKALDFMVANPQYTNQLNCQDDHCITPEHPSFKPDLNFFRQQVPKQWSFIQSTMENDPILERRRAAIFLLPYLKQPNFEANVLLKLLDDKSHLIRHDALRVYGEVFAKHPDIKVSIAKISLSLSACDEAERNKIFPFNRRCPSTVRRSFK